MSEETPQVRLPELDNGSQEEPLIVPAPSIGNGDGTMGWENTQSQEMDLQAMRLHGRDDSEEPAFNVDGNSRFVGDLVVNGTLEVNGDLIVRGRIIQESPGTNKQKEVILEEEKKTEIEKFDRFQEIRRRA